MVSKDGVWTVEGIVLDRGQGPKPYLRLTGCGPASYCRTVAELARYVDLARLVTP